MMLSTPHEQRRIARRPGRKIYEFMSFPSVSVGFLMGGGSANSLLFQPGADQLESWHEGDQRLSLASQLAGAGTSPPIVTLTGSLTQSIGLYVDTNGTSGARGVASYRAFIGGGPPEGESTPYQSGTTAAVVPITGLPGGTLNLNFENAPFSANNNWTGKVSTWENLTGTVRTLTSPSLLSSKPTVRWQAINGRAAVHGQGSGNARLDDLTSSWAANLANGTQTPFSVWLVCKLTSAAPVTVGSFFSLSNQSDFNPVVYLGIRNGTNLYRAAKSNDAGSQINVDSVALDTNWNVLAWIQTGTTIKMWKNGTLMYTTAQNVTGACTYNAVSLFSYLRNGTPGAGLIGDIAAEATYRGIHPAPNAINDYFLNQFDL